MLCVGLHSSAQSRRKQTHWYHRLGAKVLATPIVSTAKQKGCSRLLLQPVSRDRIRLDSLNRR